MHELHRIADKLFDEVDHLEAALDADDISEDRIALAIAAAKRVRRDVTMVLRNLAEIRDNATTQEGISNE
jgi:hypothetical protein